MKTTKLGLWLVGARGGVATTAMLGLFAQRKGLAGPAGLVTELPQFAHLSLPSWEDFVVGGHEIRSGAVIDQLHRFSRQNRVLSADLIDSCAAELRQADDEIRPGMLWQVGPRIAEMSDLPETSIDTTGQAAVDRIQADLSAFQRRHSLDSVVVVNLASTEATPPPDQWPAAWNDVQRQLGRNDCPLPASSLYAIAAFELGFPFVNFTPSLGALPEGIEELALLRGACHAGRDGKTGETLLKSVLAPMFASRNLEVMSWVGHNIFGNLDGKVLDDPRNKSSKVASKDQLLGEILGYSPQSHISIEHIESLGDWKTAWDHIHFAGFLGAPMVLQLTWQGCDSLLAAPLVLDLARLVAVADQRGQTGPLAFLSSFFKSPIGDPPTGFADQFRALEIWAGAMGNATADDDGPRC